MLHRYNVLDRPCLLLPLIALVACGPVVIDTSTDETLKATMARARESLPEDRRDEFDAAALAVMGTGLDIEGIFASAVKGTELDVEKTSKSMKDKVHGMSADDVFAAAAAIKAEQDKKREEREEAERAKALEEIAKLEAKAAAAEAARKQLEEFRVTSARYYRKKERFSGPQPVIELSVTNATDVAVSRAYFRGVVTSPGRAVAWIDEEFNYSIPGGIEPGETADWSFEPNIFGAWNVDAPRDTILTVTCLRINGPDGETVYDAEGLSDYEQERLADLEKRVAQ